MSGNLQFTVLADVIMTLTTNAAVCRIVLLSPTDCTDRQPMKTP